ncbi:MAG: hypothetical protein KDK62_02280, partial [Chlamydiia bacterium]|nr:hypothetical protein [Chlamydiia bacterium]
LVFSLALYTHLQRSSSIPPTLSGVTWSPEKFIVIEISGEVIHPGDYIVKKNTLIKEILDQAIPTPEANLSKLPLNKPITRKIHLKIPSTKKKLLKKL